MPLAYVSCWLSSNLVETNKFLGLVKKKVQTNLPFLQFTNGITRTIWLLSNGCQQFPIECPTIEAKILYEHAAVPNTELTTVSSLLDSLQPENPTYSVHLSQ